MVHGSVARSIQGTTKSSRKTGQVCAVFCLARRTMLLAAAGGRTEFARTIVDACREEPIPIGGVMGEWNLAESIWSILRTNPSFNEVYAAKEILTRMTSITPSRVTRVRTCDISRLPTSSHGTSRTRATMLKKASRYMGRRPSAKRCFAGMPRRGGGRGYSTMAVCSRWRASTLSTSTLARSGASTLREGSSPPRRIADDDERATRRLGPSASVGATHPVHRRTESRRSSPV